VEQTYMRGGSKDTRRKNWSVVRRLAAATNDRQVGTLTPEHIEAFFYGPGGLVETCARTTLATYRNTLKTFLAWCYRRKWCDEPDYLLGGVLDVSTKSRRVRLRLSESQMWSMVEAARDARDRAMLTFAMHTGCRISEIIAVRLRDLNLETGEVHVKIIKTREEDVMRIAPALDRELRAWLTAYTERHNPPSDAYLFPARAPARLVGIRHASDAERGYSPHSKISSPGLQIRAMADAAGIELEDGDGWHTIRRSVARLFFDRASARGHDAALRMTSAFLHHRNTTTTEIYLGLQLEKAKRDEIMSDGFLIDMRDNVTKLRSVENG
jgi:integrase